MKNQKRVTRRKKKKKMGISALALTGGAQAVALLTQSCSNTNGETFPLKADLDFTAESFRPSSTSVSVAELLSKEWR